MRRAILGMLLALLVLAAGIAIFGYQRIRALDHEPVSGDVHAIRGLGGNVAVLRTDRGAVVVDTMTFRMQGERVRELAERLGGGPVQAIVNTHYHRDHTHGNPAFPTGTRVVATDRTREHLLARDAGYWQGAAAGTLPNETFSREHELRIGGKTIRLYNLGRGHTDGDLVVLFVEDRVAALGDLLFYRLYPRIDLEAGGSVREWIDTLDRVLALDFDRVLPGHGAVTDRSGLRAFQNLLREVWSLAETAAREGKTLEETLATASLQHDAGYGTIGIPFVYELDRASMIESAWQEATAALRAGER